MNNLGGRYSRQEKAKQTCSKSLKIKYINKNKGIQIKIRYSLSVKILIFFSQLMRRQSSHTYETKTKMMEYYNLRGCWKVLEKEKKKCTEALTYFFTDSKWTIEQIFKIHPLKLYTIISLNKASSMCCTPSGPRQSWLFRTFYLVWLLEVFSSLVKLSRPQFPPSIHPSIHTSP